MPDKRKHRGPHPEDRKIFGEEKLVVILKEAAVDLCYLLDRGYSWPMSLKLVGDHFQLVSRQRLCLMRGLCSREQVRLRREKRVQWGEALRGKSLVVDGFNQIISVEVALSGGLLVQGRDGGFRDLASVHGNYRRVEETEQAVGLLLKEIAKWEMKDVIFLLDRPVSNSGKLAQIIREMGQGMRLQVDLVDQVDKELKAGGGIIASSDGGVLDDESVKAWTNLVEVVVGNAWNISFAEFNIETH